MNKLDKQIKVNYSNMMKIDKGYQDLVTNIVCYLRGKLNSVDAEEAINDVNYILLGAQSRGEDLGVLVGDYKEFCENIIDAYRGSDKWYSLKSYFYDFGGISVYMLVFFIALDILSSISNVKPLTLSNILNMKYTISLAPIISLIIALIFSIGVVKYICTHPVENENGNKKEAIMFFIIIFIVLSFMVASTFFFRKIEIFTFSNIPIIIIIASLVCLAVIGANIIKFIKVRRMDKVSNKYKNI
ncbi:hypothetical protein [Clostridium paraputrificum]|uniref:hypothetical protein n=1 Tax=Clostridium paraputrificum TaxID=29363 RepID=UPI0018A04DAF|nr:hypothetical protein [Clostridium paraputrificum]